MKQAEWEIIDETASEVELHGLLYALVKMLKPNLVVETGCYRGDATAALGRAVCENQKGRVITCDTVAENVLITRARVKNMSVDVRHCSSLDAERFPELATADFLFSDSDYKFRAGEIGRAKKGCVILVHDTNISYDSTIPPLKGLVEDIGGINFDTYRGFGLLRKKI